MALAYTYGRPKCHYQQNVCVCVCVCVSAHVLYVDVDDHVQVHAHGVGGLETLLRRFGRDATVPMRQWERESCGGQFG